MWNDITQIFAIISMITNIRSYIYFARENFYFTTLSSLTQERHIYCYGVIAAVWIAPNKKRSCKYIATSFLFYIEMSSLTLKLSSILLSSSQSPSSPLSSSTTSSIPPPPHLRFPRKTSNFRGRFTVVRASESDKSASPNAGDSKPPNGTLVNYPTIFFYFGEISEMCSLFELFTGFNIDL